MFKQASVDDNSTGISSINIKVKTDDFQFDVLYIFWLAKQAFFRYIVNLHSTGEFLSFGSGTCRQDFVSFLCGD